MRTTYTDGTPMTPQDQRDYTMLTEVIWISSMILLALIVSLFAGAGGAAVFIGGALSTSAAAVCG